MTTALVILTLVAAGLIVVALALVLSTILVLLRKTVATLGAINTELRTIAQRVEPLQPVLGDLNTELAVVERELSTALAEHRTPSGV